LETKALRLRLVSLFGAGTHLGYFLGLPSALVYNDNIPVIGTTVFAYIDKFSAMSVVGSEVFLSTNSNNSFIPFFISSSGSPSFSTCAVLIPLSSVSSLCTSSASSINFRFSRFSI
jgi:hypothetical protein